MWRHRTLDSMQRHTSCHSELATRSMWRTQADSGGWRGSFLLSCGDIQILPRSYLRSCLGTCTAMHNRSEDYTSQILPEAIWWYKKYNRNRQYWYWSIQMGTRVQDGKAIKYNFPHFQRCLKLQLTTLFFFPFFFWFKNLHTWKVRHVSWYEYHF